MNQSPPDDPLDSPWQSLLSDWESDERHAAFIGLAASLERLPDAARRYRESLADDSRRSRAQNGLDRVLRVAMLALTPPTREVRPPLNLTLPIGAFAGLLLVTILAAQATGFRALTSPVVVFAEAVVVALIPWRRFASRD